MVNADGTNRRSLTEPAGDPLGVGGPVWSPTGEWIAFITQDGVITLVHPDGSDRHDVSMEGGVRTVGSVSALDADGRLVAWRLGPDDSCGDVEAWRIGTPTVISFPAQERIDLQDTDMIDDFVAVAGDRVAWTSVLDKDAPFGVAVARRVTAAASGETVADGRP